MNTTEANLRAIKDRIAAALGELDERAGRAENKEDHEHLSRVARELHRCADDMQNVLMRVRPR